MLRRTTPLPPNGRRRFFDARIAPVVVGMVILSSAGGCVSKRPGERPAETLTPPASHETLAGNRGAANSATDDSARRDLTTDDPGADGFGADDPGADDPGADGFGADDPGADGFGAETDTPAVASSPPIRLAAVRFPEAARQSDALVTSAPAIPGGQDLSDGNPPVEDSEDVGRTSDDADRANENRERLPAPRPSIELIGPEALTAAEPDGIPLRRVIESVHQNFPLVEAAYLERDRTSGEQLAARGAFDTKLNASTENQPLGFYETYRHQGGVKQPLYGGADVYGGYRTGRGVFEPWYQERQTNDGGEFSAGVTVPLARNRAIDARRAELWRTTYDRQIAEPEIRRELISIVRDAAIAYWEWVAAGQQYQIGRSALELAEDRNDGLERQVEAGDIDPPVLKDNLRAIADRQSVLLERRRRFEQAAVKLSLYLRGQDATPISPNQDELPSFPEIPRLDRGRLESLVETALLRRPELQTLDLTEQRLRVDLAEAANDLRPNVDAGVKGSQDLGAPTSPKRDKSEFELAMGVYFELPVQRRKGSGKLRATRAKLAQLDAKRRFTLDKIATEVQAAVAALDAAAGQVERSRESVSLAEELAEIERIKFSVGESDLLAVFLREQFAIEAADKLVVALLRYHAAQTDLLAAIGNLWVDESELESAVRSDEG